jgi:hypothetical protein
MTPTRLPGTPGTMLPVLDDVEPEVWTSERGAGQPEHVTGSLVAVPDPWGTGPS